jgi:hypothetical protein
MPGLEPEQRERLQTLCLSLRARNINRTGDFSYDIGIARGRYIMQKCSAIMQICKIARGRYTI